MKKLKCVMSGKGLTFFFLILFFFCSASGLLGVTLFDDFTGTTIDTSKWEVVITNGHSATITQNNELIFTQESAGCGWNKWSQYYVYTDSTFSRTDSGKVLSFSCEVSLSDAALFILGFHPDSVSTPASCDDPGTSHAYFVPRYGYHANRLDRTLWFSQNTTGLMTDLCRYPESSSEYMTWKIKVELGEKNGALWQYDLNDGKGWVNGRDTRGKGQGDTGANYKFFINAGMLGGTWLNDGGKLKVDDVNICYVTPTAEEDVVIDRQNWPAPSNADFNGSMDTRWVNWAAGLGVVTNPPSVADFNTSGYIILDGPTDCFGLHLRQHPTRPQRFPYYTELKLRYPQQNVPDDNYQIMMYFLVDLDDDLYTEEHAAVAFNLLNRNNNSGTPITPKTQMQVHEYDGKLNCTKSLTDLPFYWNSGDMYLRVGFLDNRRIEFSYKRNAGDDWSYFYTYDSMDDGGVLGIPIGCDIMGPCEDGVAWTPSVASDAAEASFELDWVHFSYPDQPKTPGLVGWWKLDETSGSTAYDSSGNNNHGTVTGAAWNGGDGLDFDGSNDYLSIPTGAFSPVLDTNELTIALWQYGDGGSNRIFEITKTNPIASCHLPSGSTVYWDAGNYTEGSGRLSVSTGSSSHYTGGWNHWAFTKNKNTGEVQIYLNGSLVKSGTGNTVAFESPTKFYIGASGPTSQNYDGKIKDFRLYNAVLPSSQIAELATDRSLVGWWKFDDFSGRDASGYGNHATISGPEWKNGALEFDPDSNDYVSVPVDAFSPVLDTNEVTISLWQYGYNGAGNRIFDIAAANPIASCHLPSGTTVYWDAGNYTEGSGRLSKATRNSDDYTGKWNHWAFTKNKSSGEVKIYLNGSLWKKGTGNTVAFATPTKFYIGCSGPGTSHYDGMIDDFRLYSRVLSPSEVAKLAIDRNLVGWWKFNEVSGIVAKDSSGYNNHGNVVGATVSSHALNFDGTNDYVEVQTSAFEPVLRSQATTISLWQYGDSGSGNRIFEIAKTNPVASCHLPSGTTVYWDAGGYGPDPNEGRISASISDPNDYKSRWNHWAFTKDPSLGKAEIYLNGILLKATSYNRISFEYPSKFYIGASGPTSQNYDGKIKDFRLYDRVLTASEIAEQATDHSLIGWWKFDEDIGRDSSGYGNHGAITGATWSDGALDFDGTDDYVSVPVIAFDPVLDTDEVTIVLWQYGDTGSNNRIFEIGSTSPIASCHLPYGTTIYWDAGNFTEGDGRLSKSTNDPNDYKGRWNHWAFTKKKSTGAVQMYLNGSLWKSGTGNDVAFDNPTVFNIGTSQPGSNHYNGKIDDFRLYNRILSSTEIADLAVDRHLIGWWKFDETSGERASDSSGHSHHGRILGTAVWDDTGGIKSLDCDGSNDIVSIAVGAFDPIMSTEQLSICLWQYGDTGSTNRIFEIASGNPVASCHLPAGTTIYWDAGNYTEGDGRLSKSTNDPNDYKGNWNHWAFTKNPDTGNTRIYLNGSLWKSGAGNDVVFEYPTIFNIGASNPGSQHYDGRIDDFRLYSRELSASDVNDIYSE